MNGSRSLDHLNSEYSDACDKLFSLIMEGDFLMFETGSGKLESILP